MDRWMKIKIAVGAVLAVLVLAVLSAALVHKYMPNHSMMALSEYYYVEESEAMLILETSVYEQNAQLQNGGIYIPYALFVELVESDFYYDAEEKVLSCVRPGEWVQARVGETDCTVNGETHKETAAPLVFLEGELYLSLEFAARYAELTYEFYEGPNRVLLHYQWVDTLCLDTKGEETPLRFEADIKSKVLRNLPEGTRLYYLAGTGTGRKSFLRVMTEDGICGYVQRKFLGDSYYLAKSSGYQEPETEFLTLDGHVRLGWHQITRAEANGNLAVVTKNAGAMNVIAPTWYRVVDAEGGISSLSDAAYVQQAHDMGLLVWALVDNFDTSVDFLELLSSTSARRRLIDGLVSDVRAVGADGINLDFEALSAKCGPHYVQLIKELSVVCHEEGLALSVDNYVPASYNRFYDLKTQGRYVDYVIIMAYDEHYSGSPEAGSVSSIGFVQEALRNTLEKVNRERIVMGIPFYTRLWKETEENGTIRLTSEAMTMEQAENVLLQNGVTAEWNSETAQYYAEYTHNGVTYKVWLEDSASLEEKLRVIADGETAGMAAWRLGFEKEGIWELILTYIP